MVAVTLIFMLYLNIVGNVAKSWEGWQNMDFNMAFTSKYLDLSGNFLLKADVPHLVNLSGKCFFLNCISWKSVCFWSSASLCWEFQDFHSRSQLSVNSYLVERGPNCCLLVLVCYLYQKTWREHGELHLPAGLEEQLKKDYRFALRWH